MPQQASAWQQLAASFAAAGEAARAAELDMRNTTAVSIFVFI